MAGLPMGANSPKPQPSPQATSLAQFIDDNAPNNPHVDPTVVVAAGMMGKNAGTNVLNTISNVAKDTAYNVGHIFHEPSLLYNPTLAEKISWNLYNTNLPQVANQDIKRTQEFLVKGGYAPKDLPIDGTWTTDWTTSLHNFNVAKQSEHGAASFDPQKVILNLINPSMPSHALPFIFHTLKDLLHQTLTTLAAPVAQAATDIVTGQEFFGDNSRASLGDKVAAGIKSFDAWINGKDGISAEEYRKSYSAKKDLIDGLGTALTIATLVDGVGAGKALVSAGIKQGTAAGAETVAGSLFKKLAADQAAPRMTIMNTLLPKVAKDGVADAGRRFALTKSMQNIPVLRAMYPGVSKVATELGDKWAAARIIASTPYRLPIVGIAGGLASQTMMQGLKLGVIANTEKFLGDPNAPEAQVLDHLKPIAGPLGLLMDVGSVAAHAPLYGVQESARIGKFVEDARTRLVDHANQSGLLASWLRVASDEGMTYDKALQLAKDSGTNDPVGMLNAHIQNQFTQLAVNHAARIMLKDQVQSGLIKTDLEKEMDFKDVTRYIYSDPKRIEEARNNYSLTNGAFERDLRESILHSKQGKKYSMRNDLGDFLKAKEVFGSQAIPHLEHIVTPETMSKYAEENRALAEYDEALGEAGPATRLHPNDEEAVLRTNEGVSAGRYGIARSDTYTAQMQLHKLHDIASEYKKTVNPKFDPKSLFEEPLDESGTYYIRGKAVHKLDLNYTGVGVGERELEIRDALIHHLIYENGLDSRPLQIYSTVDLMRMMERQSHRLASDVIIPLHAPQELYDANEQLKKIGDGYKIVFGTDIGHAYMGYPFEMESVGSPLTRTSHILDKLGLNFDKYSPEVQGQQVWYRTLNQWQDAINKLPVGTLPSWVNAENLMTYLNKVIDVKQSKLLHKAFDVADSRIMSPTKGSNWKDEIEETYLHDPEVKNRTEALNKLKEIVTKQTGPAHWTKKQVVEALTKSDNGKIMALDKSDIDAVGASKEVANYLWNELQKGIQNRAAYLQGIDPVNKMIDSFFGLAGKDIPFTGKQVANLTGGSKRALLNWRYQASPRFAYLRVIKSALKGAAEGIPFTLDAKARMIEEGVYNKYMQIRDMYLPKVAEDEAFQDYLTQEFAKADVWNIYDPRAIEARILGELHTKALKAVNGNPKAVDKEAVLKKFNDIFSYGSRTAAEKSVNAIFFPFSFEKTVVRQLGGYILDHPGERFMIAAAMNLYDAKGPEIRASLEKHLPLFRNLEETVPGINKMIDAWNPQEWRKTMEDNFPLIKEIEKFNPFYHGIGLGTIGGINRLYYNVARDIFTNVMGPHGIKTKQGAAAVFALMPFFRDINAIAIGIDPNGRKPFNPGGELKDTFKTTAWEIGNTANHLVDWMLGKKPNEDPFAPQSHLNYDIQQTNGWNMKSAWTTAYAKTLYANAHGANYIFPSDLPVVGGKKITRQEISYLVNHIYPQWSPTQGIESVAQGKAAGAEERGIIMQKNPALKDSYDQFILNATKIAGFISKGDYEGNTDKLAQDTDTMRKLAIYLSYHDKTFYDFYKRYYETKFGPLELMQ